MFPASTSNWSFKRFQVGVKLSVLVLTFLDINVLKGSLECSKIEDASLENIVHGECQTGEVSRVPSIPTQEDHRLAR
jgi:hypothetical protein